MVKHGKTPPISLSQVASELLPIGYQLSILYLLIEINFLLIQVNPPMLTDMPEIPNPSWFHSCSLLFHSMVLPNASYLCRSNS